MSKQAFKDTLSLIHETYKSFLYDKVGEEDIRTELTFRFSVLLDLVESLYQGTQEEQKDAIEVIQGLNLNKVNDTLMLPKNTLERIIYNPESYSDNIKYSMPEADELDDQLYY